MKGILLITRSAAIFFLFVFFHLNAQAQNQIPLRDVSQYVGGTVKVCGKVYGVSLLKNVKTKPTLMNLGGSDPKERITIRIRFENRVNSLSNPEAIFLHKNICFEGTITKVHGYPEIVIDTMNASKLLAEAVATKADSTEPNSFAKKVLAIKKIDTVRLPVNAYVLAGPDLDEPIITFLKAGSTVKVGYSSSGWSYVRVLENIGKYEERTWLYGFVRNQALGLNKQGEERKKASSKNILTSPVAKL